MMLRYKKALLITMLLSISLACGLPSAISEAVGGQDSTPIAGQSQPEAADTAALSESETTDTPRLDYNVEIPTEVISPDNLLNLTKSYSYIDTTTDLNRTYVVLENNSTDPLDIVTEYSVKVTWFDENNQVISEWEQNDRWTNIFPQEKQLFQMWVDKDVVNGRKIGLVRVELSNIKTVKSFDFAEIKDKISAQPWSHPFVTTNPGAFQMQPYLITYFMGLTKVNVQSNINSMIKPEVVGIYYNEQDEIVGIGGSGPFELPALGSADVDVATLNLSSVPVRMEYYVEMPFTMGVEDMMNVLYP
jgi:hypothetical protein